MGIEMGTKSSKYVFLPYRFKKTIFICALGAFSQIAISSTQFKILCRLTVVDVSNFKAEGKMTRDTTFEIYASDDESQILFLANDMDFASVMTDNKFGRDPYVSNSSARGRWELQSKPPKDNLGVISTTSISLDRNTGNLSYHHWRAAGEIYHIRDANGTCEKVDATQKRF
jgi:hypothetical protein